MNNKKEEFPLTNPNFEDIGILITKQQLFEALEKTFSYSMEDIEFEMCFKLLCRDLGL